MPTSALSLSNKPSHSKTMQRGVVKTPRFALCRLRFCSELGAGFTKHTSSGFTLIEVLVTLVIIGLMISIVGLNLRNDPAAEAHRFATRLKKQMEFSADRAVLKQDTVGLYVEGQGYAFLGYSWRKQKWYPLLNDEATPQEIPQPYSLRLGESVEDQVIRDEDGSLIPQLIFLPTGENTAFELFVEELYSDQPSLRIFSDGFSGIRIDKIDTVGGLL
jgi:general secretion pathway protein H